MPPATTTIPLPMAYRIASKSAGHHSIGSHLPRGPTRWISSRMMSPGPRRSAASLIAVGVASVVKETAPTHACSAMPVIPNGLRSPLISPRTAVPWLSFVELLPARTPPCDWIRSSCVKRQPHSQSMIRTPLPRPPGSRVLRVDDRRRRQVALLGGEVRRDDRRHLACRRAISFRGGCSTSSSASAIVCSSAAVATDGGAPIGWTYAPSISSIAANCAASSGSRSLGALTR